MSVAKENLEGKQTVDYCFTNPMSLSASAMPACPPEAPVEWDLLVKKNVVKASFWAVLRHYGDVRHLNTTADELTEVWVIELPAEREREGQSTVWKPKSDI